MYDYIIIGGGISGLTMARIISMRYPTRKILVIEKKSRWGGRIKTIHYPEKHFHYDAGAVRIASTHKRTLKLIHELSLKLIELPSTSNNLAVNQMLSILWSKHFSNDSMKNLSLKTLYELSGKKSESWNDFMNNQVYQTMLTEKNVYDIRLHYSKNYNASVYYTVDGGLEKIIDQLVKYLENCPNVTLRYQCMALSIKKTSNIHHVMLNTRDTKHEIIQTKHIYVCIPPMNTERLFPDLTCNLSEILGSNNYLRIYGTMREQSSFDPPKTIISATYGSCTVSSYQFPQLYQISYTDGPRASQLLQYLRIMSPNEFKRRLKKEYPSLSWYQCHYWKRGTHYWKLGTSSAEYFPRILQPFSFLQNLFLCNEAFSTHQGWIEGSLESIEWVLRLQEWNYPILEYPLSKLQPEWVIYKNRKYNISSIIPMHPGGDIIRIGLGKDITWLFDSIDHSEMALTWLQKYPLI